MSPLMRRIARVVLPVALVGLAGAWLGMALWGASNARMGPFVVSLDTRFGRGVTDIVLPPFGHLTADTHLAPLRVEATLIDVRIPDLSRELADGGLEGLVARVQADATRAVPLHALRTIAVAAGGALVLALLVYRRRWVPMASSVLVAIIVVGGTETLTLVTYEHAALASPTFSGSLRLAADIIPPVRSAATTFDRYRAQLERVVDGAIRAYTSIQTNPVGGPGEIRVLHVSDIHLAPLGFAFAEQVAGGFDVDFVIDTGDTTSFGTEPENLILGNVSRLARPYVWVRGNHDSRGFQAAMARLPNAVVLDGTTTVQDGLHIYGRGSPIRPPTVERLSDDVFAERVRAEGQVVLADVEALETPVDVVAVHDDRMAEAVAGLVPLVISGHFHENGVAVVNGTLYLRVGTTGGSNFATFRTEEGIPLSAEVLYFEAGTPPRLIAFDLIEQSPQTGALTVTRHIVEAEFGLLTPSPSPSPTPTSTPSPSPTPSPTATTPA